MSRYIITGATGHIGNNFIRYLNEKEPNAKICAIVRRPNPHELIGCHVECCVGELSDAAFLEGLIHPDDIVVHLAAKIDLSDKHKEETFYTNNTLTRQICDLCRRKKVGRFLYIGSVDAIAKPNDPTAMITEPTSFSPEPIEGAYGKSKAQAAQYVLETMQRYPDFSCAMLLPSAVIGPHDYKPSAIGKVIVDVIRGKTEFALNGGYCFVDVRDVCHCMYELCNNHARNCYIVCGESLSVCELYQKINTCLGISKKQIVLPNFLITILIPFVPVLNKITVKALQEPHNYSCAKAITDLHFTPTPFEKTIADTITFFLSQT